MSTLYTIFKLLLMPPGIILLLLAIAFFRVRGGFGRLLLLGAWSLLLIMSIPAISGPLLAARQAHVAVAPAQLAATGADGIVVLAAGAYSNAAEYGESVVDAITFERLRYAAFLHRKTDLPIFVSGGGEPEAVAMLMVKALDEELGVPTTDVEDFSRTTWENAALIAPMLRAAGVHHPLLVTNAWHMARSVRAFRHQGIDVIPAPTGFVQAAPAPGDDAQPMRRPFTDWLPQASSFMISYFAIHEMLGSILYDFRAFMTAPTQPLDGRDTAELGLPEDPQRGQPAFVEPGEPETADPWMPAQPIEE